MKRSGHIWQRGKRKTNSARRNRHYKLIEERGISHSAKSRRPLTIMIVDNHTIEQTNSKATNSPFLKVENGENRYRIASLVYGVKEHRIETPNGFTSTACPREMRRWEVNMTGQDQGGELPQCPICEAIADDQAKASKWRARPQYLALAIDRRDGHVGVLKKGPSVFQPITNFNEDPEWGDVRRFDIKIMKHGQGLDTAYQVMPLPHDSPITEAEQEAVKQSGIDLEKMTSPLSYAKIIEKLGDTLTRKLSPPAPNDNEIPF